MDRVTFVKAWLAALRSGKYNQCTSRLQSIYGYCCLGVACKVAIYPTKLELNGCLFGGDLNEQPELKEFFHNQLLLNARGWIEDDIVPSLTSLNDNENFTFPEIADFIEVTYGSEWGL